jgi:hypothetical protein
VTRTEAGDEGRGPDSQNPSGVSDDVTSALAREVYWAEDGVSRLPGDARSLRERLDAFTYQMRADQRQAVPVGETFLGSDAGWKRGLKQFVWRLTRFSTMRYDRLLAELAEMNGELARRLLATEEEVSRLRRELDDRDGERP